MQSEVWDLVLRWLVPFVCGSVMSLASALVAGMQRSHKKENAFKKGVPMVNYGMAIAHMNGILKRSLQVFG